MHEVLFSYGLRPIGTVKVEGDDFRITVSDSEHLAITECIYAFVVNDEIVRVGSSKGKLKSRFKAWERDVSRALKNEKSPTPTAEAEGWREITASRNGLVYARLGTMVETPVGRINSYLAEEKVLIERHKPRFGRR